MTFLKDYTVFLPSEFASKGLSIPIPIPTPVPTPMREQKMLVMAHSFHAGHAWRVPAAGYRRLNTYVAQQRGGLRNARPEKSETLSIGVPESVSVSISC
jgi:hypothetical protein